MNGCLLPRDGVGLCVFWHMQNFQQHQSVQKCMHVVWWVVECVKDMLGVFGGQIFFSKRCL